METQTEKKFRASYSPKSDNAVGKKIMYYFFKIFLNRKIG